MGNYGAKRRAHVDHAKAALPGAGLSMEMHNVKDIAPNSIAMETEKPSI
jgi:hypothetical protein